MLASVWKYKTINFFLCTVEWFFLFFPLPIPHMTTATIYRNGNHWKFPWKMNSLETFWRRQLIKIPTFRLTGLFPLCGNWFVCSLPDSFGCQCSLLKFYSSYLASQYWEHHLKPSIIILIHMEDTSFFIPFSHWFWQQNPDYQICYCCLLFFVCSSCPH